MILQTVVSCEKSRHLWCSLHTTAARWSSRQWYDVRRAEICGVVYTQQQQGDPPGQSYGLRRTEICGVVYTQQQRDDPPDSHAAWEEQRSVVYFTHNSSEMILLTVVWCEKSRDLWCSLHTTAARWSSRQSCSVRRADICGVVYTQQQRDDPPDSRMAWEEQRSVV